MLPGSPAHLIRRFFDVASSRPLNDIERDRVHAWLSAPLEEMFFQQPDCDQRHAYNAACTVIDAGFDDPEIVTAALMHDIGKRHARLGLVGRSIASVIILAGIKLPPRVATYRDHGLIAARELGELRAPSLAIDFALHHHGQRPPTIPSEVWDALIAADQPAKTPGVAGGPITSVFT